MKKEIKLQTKEKIQVNKTYTSRVTYLLTQPFPMEEVKLGKTKDKVLRFLYKGENPHSISKELRIARPTTIQHLQELRKIGLTKKGEDNKGRYGDLWIVTEKGIFLIEKCVGFPVISSHKGQLSPKSKVRGHGFIWKVKPNKKFEWEKLLREKEIKFTPKGFANTPRIIFNKKKIWLGKNYITIFLPKDVSFFAKKPTQSRNNAIFELIEDIEQLKETLGIAFEYKFTCRRQHYGFVDNYAARFFIKRKKKILIKNEKGYWFSIDFSQNKYKEAEVLKDDEDLTLSTGYQKYMNSHEKTKFKVTPDFILKTMNGIQQNQMLHSENIKSHIKAIQDLGKGVRELVKKVGELK